jgi:hypothetical protein
LTQFGHLPSMAAAVLSATKGSGRSSLAGIIIRGNSGCSPQQSRLQKATLALVIREQNNPKSIRAYTREKVGPHQMSNYQRQSYSSSSSSGNSDSNSNSNSDTFGSVNPLSRELEQQIQQLDVGTSSRSPTSPNAATRQKLQKPLETPQKINKLSSAQVGALEATAEDLQDVLTEILSTPNFHNLFKGSQDPSKAVYIHNVKLNADCSHAHIQWKSDVLEIFVRICMYRCLSVSLTSSLPLTLPHSLTHTLSHTVSHTLSLTHRCERLSKKWAKMRPRGL